MELNFNNCKFSTNNIMVFESEINETVTVKVDSTSLLLNNLKTKENIIVNYSLICFGNIEADKIIVQNDLICFGNLICNKLEVYGELKCYGDLRVKEIEVTKNSIISSGMVEFGVFNSNIIIMNALEIVKKIIVNGNVFCNEGIFGEGQLECEKITANEYLEVKVLNHAQQGKDNSLEKLEAVDNLQKFIVSDVYKKNIQKYNFMICEIKEEISTIEKSSEFEDIKKILFKISKEIPEFKSDYIILKNILNISKMDHIDDLVLYLKLVDYRKRISSYIMDISICNEILNNFIVNEKKYVDNMKVDSIENHKDFITTLYLLESNKNFFNYDEYISILDKIYSKIGIKANMVKKFVKLGEIING